MKIIKLLVVIILINSCNNDVEKVVFHRYSELSDIKAQEKHENKRMRFKLIQSKVLDLNPEFEPFHKELAQFSEKRYKALQPLILEQPIPSVQSAIKNGMFTYRDLVLFYLYRIRKFESDSMRSLQAIIALNPDVIRDAEQKDRLLKEQIDIYSLQGMPILLKDNINTSNMPTTAGALILQKHETTTNAFVVDKLLASGALILGKVNLSEWAYFFCSGCPLGYSAIGGQTLNPYGRKIFETGGSSSGSGVSVAVNFAVAAVGTETAGSIISPSSQNSIVGLKPTIGVLSRSGIIPISGTLDTPGPMTKNVIDNMIVFKAMLGKDSLDKASLETDFFKLNHRVETVVTMRHKRFGVLKPLLSDSIYNAAVEKIEKAGAEIIEIVPPEITLKGFVTLLNIDMKNALHLYFKQHGIEKMRSLNIQSILNFNNKDSILRAPYGQKMLEGIMRDTTNLRKFEKIKNRLKTQGKWFLNPLFSDKLDAILSINNYHSGVAAVAQYPTLTVPMGYKESGEPIGLTFIGKPFTEEKILRIGYAFENLTKVRHSPEHYE